MMNSMKPITSKNSMQTIGIIKLSSFLSAHLVVHSVPYRIVGYFFANLVGDLRLASVSGVCTAEQESHASPPNLGLGLVSLLYGNTQGH